MSLSLLLFPISLQTLGFLLKTIKIIGRRKNSNDQQLNQADEHENGEETSGKKVFVLCVFLLMSP